MRFEGLLETPQRGLREALGPDFDRTGLPGVGKCQVRLYAVACHLHLLESDAPHCGFGSQNCGECDYGLALPQFPAPGLSWNTLASPKIGQASRVKSLP